MSYSLFKKFLKLNLVTRCVYDQKFFIVQNSLTFTKIRSNLICSHFFFGKSFLKYNMFLNITPCSGVSSLVSFSIFKQSFDLYKYLLDFFKYNTFIYIKINFVYIDILLLFFYFDLFLFLFLKRWRNVFLICFSFPLYFCNKIKLKSILL